MAKVFAKSLGVWKEQSSIHGKDAGLWSPFDTAFGKESGVWKEGAVSYIEPELYCPESDTYYNSFAEWVSGEKGSIFKTLEIKGAFNEYFQLRDDEFLGGCKIKAASGHEFDPSNLNGSHARTLSDIRIVSRTSGIAHTVEGIEFYTADLEHARADHNPVWLKNCYFNAYDKMSDKNVLLSGATGFVENCVIDCRGSSKYNDGLYSGTTQSSTIVNHCVVIGAGRYGVVRVNTRNSIVMDSGNTDFYSASYAHYCAISDESAQDAQNNIKNMTTAELVDFAGGDWRTKATSTLAKAGQGGTYIGAGLES